MNWASCPQPLHHSLHPWVSSAFRVRPHPSSALFLWVLQPQASTLFRHRGPLPTLALSWATSTQHPELGCTSPFSFSVLSCPSAEALTRGRSLPSRSSPSLPHPHASLVGFSCSGLLGTHPHRTRSGTRPWDDVCIPEPTEPFKLVILWGVWEPSLTPPC